MADIRKLKGGGNPDELADSLRAMQEVLPHMIEHGKIAAKLHREKYLALKAEGFTNAQALELCKDILA